MLALAVSVQAAPLPAPLAGTYALPDGPAKVSAPLAVLPPSGPAR